MRGASTPYEETVAVFQPQPYHMAIPGYVYGGLLASIIDCHGTGTAAAAAYWAEQRAMDTQPPIRFLTASLHVDYLRPTPLGVPLELRGRVKEFQGRKVIVSVSVSANGHVCVRGEVVAVHVPERWILLHPRGKLVGVGREQKPNHVNMPFHDLQDAN
jgi:acyl-coenzyme A thioesterase PaaI-like protein